MDEMLILGKAIADTRLEGLESWPYPDVTLSREAIFNNAYNHTFELKEPEELKSEQLVLPTLDEIERIRHDAHQEGIVEGRKVGLEQGIEEGKPQGFDIGKQEGIALGETEGLQLGLKRAQTLVDEFHGLMTQLSQPISSLEHDIEQQMLLLVTALAEGVLLESIRVNPENIITLIRRGVEALPYQHQNIILNLHPDDRALVITFFGEDQFSEQHWSIEVDAHLQRGELRIETTHSEVDLTLATRLQAIFQAVLHQQQVPPEPYVEVTSQPPDVSHPPTPEELSDVEAADNLEMADPAETTMEAELADIDAQPVDDAESIHLETRETATEAELLPPANEPDV
ncbi:MAG: flagellar assembly protein FliH [Shewanellaceae bacterium]|nr:flagellar assembly protein FliH [Shewanellaceae bacterium]